MWNAAPGALGQGARTALSTTRTLNTLAATAPHVGMYPATDLGRTLAECAVTIKAGVGVRVITVDFGGWDMHTGLGTIDAGAMVLKLDELARSLAGFFSDLGTARRGSRWPPSASSAGGWT